jgi:probable HAF family extracellular repeat protein
MVNNAYLIGDLGTLYRGTESFATAINDLGVVVGGSETLVGSSLFMHAFRHSNGVMSDLGTLPGLPESYAQDVNAAGWIVGIGLSFDEVRPFLWKPGQGMLDLGHLDNKGGTYAYAINNSGVVVGISERENAAGDFRNHAFRWTANSGMKALGAEHDNSWAYDVNDAGWVVGAAGMPSHEHAYVWDPSGNGIDIGTLGGGYSIAYAINNAGVVIGESELTNGGWHAFRWTPWTGMADLGAVLGYFGSPEGLSEKGRIVGSYLNSYTGSQAATLFGRTPPASLVGLAPNKQTFAYGVNTCGEIVGAAVTSANRRHAVRWVRTMGVCD